MTDHRKRYDGTFKAKVVLESLKNEKTIAELASDYGVHPNQITQWRKQALEDLPALFSSKQAKKDRVYEEERGELLKQIGQLKNQSLPHGAHHAYHGASRRHVKGICLCACLFPFG
jgi:transposase-like protein